MRGNTITGATMALLRTVFPEAALHWLRPENGARSGKTEHGSNSCSRSGQAKPERFATRLRDVDMFVLHNEMRGIGDLLPDLSGQLKSVTTFSHIRGAFQCMRRISDPGAVFLVDIDVFDTTETAVEELISLRRHAPLLSVVMVSYDFRRNDFSAERKTIADCSLILPATEESLSKGVRCALENAGLRLSMPHPAI